MIVNGFHFIISLNFNWLPIIFSYYLYPILTLSHLQQSTSGGLLQLQAFYQTKDCVPLLCNGDNFHKSIYLLPQSSLWKQTVKLPISKSLHLFWVLGKLRDNINSTIFNTIVLQVQRQIAVNYSSSKNWKNKLFVRTQGKELRR